MGKDLKGMRIGCAMTGSFCTFKRVFDTWRELKSEGAELFPIMSFNAASIDTRFYAAKDAVGIFEEICGRPVLRRIEEVEPIGPKKMLDLLIVAPCTGNSIAKIANGISDTPVTLAVKSHLRNARPVLLAVSSNDALSQNALNVGKLLNMKQFYFVPYRQDAPGEKAFSTVSDFGLVLESAKMALSGAQMQPILTAK